MALTFKEIDFSEIRRLGCISVKIIVGILILIYFGTSLVICNSDIPFCDKQLKELRQDEKDWSTTCTNDEGQSNGSVCCQAKKNNNLKRMCVYTKTCFYEGIMIVPNKSSAELGMNVFIALMFRNTE